MIPPSRGTLYSEKRGEWMDGKGALTGKAAPVEMEPPRFVRFMIERLTGAGFKAYLVGGAVRDACMGRVIRDWDLATDAHAEAILRLFPDVRSFRLKHETVTLVSEGVRYEITPFRRTSRNGGSLEHDLSHRDFTLNAMAYDPARRALLDPEGGRGDIRRRLIRAVGRPRERFEEDPVRLLRAVRFAVTLGFDLEETTLSDLTASSPLIAGAAAERVRDELSAVLIASRPSRGIRIMRRTGLLGRILPELAEGHLVRQNEYHRYTVLRHTLETVDRVAPTPLLRWTALLHDVAKPRVRTKEGGRWRFDGHAEAGAETARAVMERLRLDHALISGVVRLIRNHMIGYRPEWSDGAVRRLVRRVGPENIGSLIAFRKADIRAHGRPELRGTLLEELEKRVRGVLDEPRCLGRDDLALNGRDVMGVTGLSPGPLVGRILDELLERVTENPSLNRPDTLKPVVREIYGEVLAEENHGRERSGNEHSGRDIRPVEE